MNTPEKPVFGCSVCRDPRRAKVDDALIRGVGVRVVARQFNLAKSTVGEHRARRHHARALAGVGSSVDGSALLGRLRESEDMARRLAAKAEKKGDVRVAVSALAEANRAADLIQRAMLEEADAGVDDITEEKFESLLVKVLSYRSPESLDQLVEKVRKLAAEGAAPHVAPPQFAALPAPATEAAGAPNLRLVPDDEPPPPEPS